MASSMRKAVFLDRDGVINELIYYQEQGIIDSPFTLERFKLRPGVGEAIARLNRHGYKVIVVSNQPGVAKGHFTPSVLRQMDAKLEAELKRDGALLDGIYYCLHHPEATLTRYRRDCDCRKPKPGLLLKAAAEVGIDLRQSWIIGDNLTDIQAGKAAGVKTILLGKMKCELCDLMDEQCTRPDIIVSDLAEAVKVILSEQKPVDINSE